MQKSFGQAISSRPRIDQLEMHVSHACNLTCESCSHYSNQNHKGNVDLQEADRWMSAWSGRVEVGTFKLLGGEPTINPDLVMFPALVRKHWPNAQIWIVTNGFFLHRHPELPKAFSETGNCWLYLSIHHDDPAYRKKVAPVLDLLARWEKDYGMSIGIWQANARWTRRYLGFGDQMLPYDDQDQRRSWEHCVARDSRQLFEEKIWKCPPLIYLPLQHKKYVLSKVWDPYLAYEPLGADCTDDDIVRFLALEDEAVCSMCAADPVRFELRNPMRGTLAHPQDLDPSK